MVIAGRAVHGVRGSPMRTKHPAPPTLMTYSCVAVALVMTLWPSTQGRAAEASETTTMNTTKQSHGYVIDIEASALKNNEFRQVLYTAKFSQLVLMALKPKEDIGSEIHKLDQFFRVEAGSGEVVLDGIHTPIKEGFAVLVPAGSRHNIINTGSVPMKLYTLYSPPNHRDGVIHHTRAEAEADNEQFDGKTSP
jgi:mannose-6-phosphate isomerase-like protein (cupin superfamily)